MQINGGRKIGIVVKNVDTRNKSTAKKTEHLTQFCGYVSHVTHFMSWKTKPKQFTL